MNEYLEQLTDILDKASGELSLQEYIELCYEIADDAKTRARAAEEDQE